MQKIIKYIALGCITVLFIGCTNKAPITKRSQMILMSHS